MKSFFPLLVATAFVLGSLARAEPLYSNDFEKSELEKVPEDFMVISGMFAVKSENGNRFLELAGAPLDTFGLLFGPADQMNLNAAARFFATKQGRKFPTFALSVNGIAGYRLQVSPAKKALELFKGDEAKSSVPFEWHSGAWTRLRLDAAKSSNGWLVQGKAWPANVDEPAKWMIIFQDKEEPPTGRPGIWGTPYAGTPIRFDDLTVAKPPAKK